jgi:hypothetical protein
MTFERLSSDSLSVRLPSNKWQSLNSEPLEIAIVSHPLTI